MKNSSHIFSSTSSQILYTLICPAFFMVFVLLYKPMDSENFFVAGRNMFSFNLTLYSAIILVMTALLRFAFRFVEARKISIQSYIIWCAGEIILTSLFCALYMCLILKGEIPYFKVLGECLTLNATTLIYPYAIISLALQANERAGGSIESQDENKLIKIHDENKKLKLVIDSASVIYIESEENYIRIHYNESGKLKEYVVRTSMKSLEDLLSKYGIIRCHRSYFINPSHVRVLKKMAEGVIVAELDSNDLPSIPVSKRYYDNLSNIL